jgi:cyclopropane fatty-acyl-phospholipid synthase-like methyltransferase
MKIYGDEIYERQFSTTGWGKYPPEEVIQFFMYAKKKLGPSRLNALDIGCGIGNCSWFMAKEGAIVTAMDGAPSGIGYVNTLAREFGVQDDIKVVLGDITDPKKFINSTFNIMVDNFSLYSNEEGRTFNGYREYYDILEKGGFFLTCCFGKKSSGYDNGTRLSKNTYTNIKGLFSKGGTQSFFVKIELMRLFKDIGYFVDYYSNKVEIRNGQFIEKHITCLRK